MPSFRLAAKEQPADGRCRKVHEKKPRTPYKRLTESPDVSEECKAGGSKEQVRIIRNR
jgi:hypothetical protein